MPKLRAFIACEKVIYDEKKVPSLISLFSSVEVRIMGGMPADAVIPKDWAIFTMWDAEPGDAGVAFVQCTQILWPDGKPFLDRNEHALKFEPGKPNYLHRLQMGAFPVGKHGDCTIRVWLESNGTVVAEPALLKVNVKHTKVPETENAQVSPVG